MYIFHFPLFRPFAIRCHKRTIDHCTVAFHFCDSVWSLLMKTKMFSLLIYICIVDWGAIDQLQHATYAQCLDLDLSALSHGLVCFGRLNECLCVCCSFSVYARVCVCVCVLLHVFITFTSTPTLSITLAFTGMSSTVQHWTTIPYSLSMQ
jgi:hypothetical protein